MGDDGSSDIGVEEGQRKYNVGVISEWHQVGTDYHVFLTQLRPGDLIEFKRDGYCHWAVYIGEHAFAENTEADDLIPVLPCIVHRANPTDNPENMNGMFSASKSLRKGLYGIGDVVVEPLRDVWRESGAKINNGMDTTIPPFPAQKIVERALCVVHGEDRQSYTPYNVLTNNCEHFASWCRSGWSVSSQVARRMEQLVKLGMVAGAAVLPRPLSIMGGLCLAGLQMMTEVRRSASSQSQNGFDFARDQLDDLSMPAVSFVPSDGQQGVEDQIMTSGGR
eukprot:GFUD01118391.1.p1 GENE.GFUD01118391.1~~GFUD01118391.1.p1  ORF type:complete len:278 (-),score=72.29 GFUD01118391.1:285-1118(-)